MNDEICNGNQQQEDFMELERTLTMCKAESDPLLGTLYMSAA